MCQECDLLRQKLDGAHSRLMDMQQTINAQADKLTRQARDLTIMNEDTPVAKITRYVLDFWQETHPKANTDSTGARFKMVRTAVGFGHTDPPLPCPVHDPKGKRSKDAMCTVGDELIEALWWIRLRPFINDQGRRVADAWPGSKRYDDLKYALCEKVAAGDRVVYKVSEAAIERTRALARRERMSDVDKLHRVYEAVNHSQNYWATMLMEAIDTLKGRQCGQPGDVWLGPPNGHLNGADQLNQGRGEGAMNGSEVSGGPESADATLFGAGGGSGDSAGGGRRVDSSEDDGGVAATQPHLPYAEPEG